MRSIFGFLVWVFLLVVVVFVLFVSGCVESNEINLIRRSSEPKQYLGFDVRPIPIPIIPVPKTMSPRLPPTLINKTKKWTLLWPVPEPSPLPVPQPIPCLLAKNLAENFIVEEYTRLLRFNEQHVTGGCAVITLTEQQAIDFVKTLPIYKGLSNEAALDHFIAIHWAWYVDTETSKA